jgi:predicted permease
MSGLLQDFRYALRQLRNNPGFTFTAVLVLTLGMAACLAIFAFVDAALIKPLPYSHPNRLVEVTESISIIPRAHLSYPDYLDWKRLNQVFSSMDAYNNTGYLLHGSAGTEPVRGVRVSDGFFRTLGVAPLIGRDFYPGEDLPEAPQTVMLSYAAWQKRFAGRKDIAGQTVTLSGVPYTIIGVMPQSFQFAPSGNAEFWTTLHASDYCGKRRSCHNLTGIGRLKDGVSVETARANMVAIARQLEIQFPADNRGQGASVIPLSEAIFSDIRPLLLALLGGAGLLLLISCANVASLLLVRSEGRKREIAVRGALGASRSRLLRQFMSEGIVLVFGAALLAVFAARGAIQLLLAMLSKDALDHLPYLAAVGVSLHVIEFAAILSVSSAALFSLTPMLRVPLRQLREGLTEGGRGHAGTLWRRFGANFVVVELALAVVLLACAGLLGKSLYRLLHVDIGFKPDHLATLGVVLSDTDYAKEERRIAVQRQIISRVTSLPGVESAGVTTTLPVTFNGNTAWIRIAGRPYHGEHNEVNRRAMSAEFLKTIGAKLLRGRYFTDAEDASKPRVAIINETFAKRYFPNEDPIGQKIGDTELSPKSIAQIIGVVQDIKDGALDAPIWPAIYYPFNQSSDTYFSLVARTSQAAGSILPALVTAIHQVDSGIGVLDESTMIDNINNSQSAYIHRSSAWLIAAFASLALLLGVVGLYAVIAYSVSQRTREIGVRMALGAQRGSVHQLVMKEAAELTALGIAAGLIAAIGTATLIRGLLFGVQSWDVATLGATSAVLSISSLLASYIPARRAAKVDPMVALRYE